MKLVLEVKSSSAHKQMNYALILSICWAKKIDGNRHSTVFHRTHTEIDGNRHSTVFQRTHTVQESETRVPVDQAACFLAHRAALRNWEGCMVKSMVQLISNISFNVSFPQRLEDAHFLKVQNKESQGSDTA